MADQSVISRSRHAIAQAILRNLGLKIFAFLGAVLLWSYVSTQPQMETVAEAFVRYVDVPTDLELNPDQAERVTVVLRGPRDRLNKLVRQELTVEVDFSETFQAGEHTFNVTAASLGLPPGVTLVKAVPSQLRLFLERRVLREVVVQPRFVGAYQPGYFLASYTVVPPRLTVEGPESRMILIDQVTTDPIDISSAVGQASFQATAYVADPYIRFVGASAVTVEAIVRKHE